MCVGRIIVYLLTRCFLKKPIKLSFLSLSIVYFKCANQISDFIVLISNSFNLSFCFCSDMFFFWRGVVSVATEDGLHANDVSIIMMALTKNTQLLFCSLYFLKNEMEISHLTSYYCDILLFSAMLLRNLFYFGKNLLNASISRCKETSFFSFRIVFFIFGLTSLAPKKS